MLIEIYEVVYKIRSSLLSHKENTGNTANTQPATVTKQGSSDTHSLDEDTHEGSSSEDQAVREISHTAEHNQDDPIEDETPSISMYLPEVLQCFLATREAMQLQQNETVYESSGTSTLPSTSESPATPDRDTPTCVPFTSVCQLLIKRCLFLLLGVRPAWQDHSQHTNNTDARKSAYSPEGQSVHVELCDLYSSRRASEREASDHSRSGSGSVKSKMGLPLCSLGIMKDAWERLRQCISPDTVLNSTAVSSPMIDQ
ncbi:probable E3 ubiquitin-protein ligase HERC1 isoform X1, partial [Tachysurus ichikawai]